MTMGLMFWILMLIWLVFGLISHYSPALGSFGVYGHTLLLFVLLLLLGWESFGPPIR